MKRHRVFLTGSGIAHQARALLVDAGCVIHQGDSRDTPIDLQRRFREFDPNAIIVRQGLISDAVQESAPSLKVICKHGAGVDNIDVASATRRGIPVMFTPGANRTAVAEHALGLIIGAVRQIPLQDRRIRHGGYDKANYGGLELSGKILGLVGFGRVARRLADLAAPFDLEVLAYHPSATDERLPPHITKVHTVEEVLVGAHIVSLHCPLTTDTRHLINASTLSLMREGAYLVNTARGGLVNEADLLQAIRVGRLAGAALDVFEKEPVAPDHPLLSVDTVIATSHTAGLSDGSVLRMGLQAAQNVLSVLRGDAFDLGSVVNPEVLDGL